MSDWNDFLHPLDPEKLKARLTRYPVIIRLPIIIIISIHLPLVIFFWGLSKYYVIYKEGYSTKSWPTTEGTINTSYVGAGHVGGDTSHTPIVNYSYFVMDKEYHSNQIFSGPTWGGSRGGAKKTIDRYTVDRKVIVYYDAKNPDQAVLEPGINRKQVLLLVFSPLLLFPLNIQLSVYGFILYFWDSIIRTSTAHI